MDFFCCIGMVTVAEIFKNLKIAQIDIITSTYCYSYQEHQIGGEVSMVVWASKCGMLYWVE